MKVEEHTKAHPQTIMQAFQQANDMVAESKNLDEMIRAYDKVINFCAGTPACRMERSTKRDVLLFWAYQNIARAYVKKKMPSAAFAYYEQALAVAHSDRQKAPLLEKMLEVVGSEDLSVADRCRKILKLANQLVDIYRKQPDNSDLHRINTLAQNTLELLKKSQN